MQGVKHDHTTGVLMYVEDWAGDDNAAVKQKNRSKQFKE